MQVSQVASGKEPACQCRRPKKSGFPPWVEKIPWRRAWQLTPVFLLEESQDEMVGWHHWVNGHELEQTLGDSEGQGCLACCSPWGCKELDMTEQLKNNNQAYIPLQPNPIKMWLLGRMFPGSGFAFFSDSRWLLPAILIPCSLLKAIYLLRGLWISCWLPCTRMSLRKKTVWKLRSLEHSLTEDCCFSGPVWLFRTPWTAARQASLSLLISWSLHQFFSILSSLNGPVLKTICDRRQ